MNLSDPYVRLRVFVAAVAAAAGGLTAPTAFAANAAERASAAIEEIVITARFREEKLQETPIAITAVTAQDIQQRALTQSFEIGYTVPNASFRPAQAAFGNTMTAYIRGVGQNDFDQAFEPGVGIYVDDVYQPFTLGSQMDLLDMDRVEVLRGPQGTLFGRGSIGGVMRLVSKKPEGSDTGFVDLTTGSFRRVDVRAGYDFSLADNVYARVTGVSKHTEGYQDVIDFACAYPALRGSLQVRDPSRGRNCKTGTQGGIDITGMRGQLRWVVSDAVETDFSVDYEKDSSEAKADTLIAIIYPTDLSGNTIPTSSYMLWNTEYAQHVPDPSAAFQNYGYGIPYDNRFVPDSIYKTFATYDDPYSGLTFKPESGLEKLSASGKLDWKLADTMTLTAVLAYTNVKGQLTSDADASPMNLQVTGGQQDFSWGTAEVRLSGRAFDRADWTLGAFLYEGLAKNQQTVSFPPILWGVFRNVVGLPPSVAASIIHSEGGKYSVNARNIADASAEAGFAHVVYDLTERARLNLGVRYSHDKKDVDFDNSFFVGPINLDSNHVDWRAGLDFKLASNVLLYGSAATGYRPPAYNPRPFTASQAVAVGGEEMTAYELGLKADMFDRTLRTNVAIFYSDYNKRIVPIGGTECVGDPVPADTPGAIQDSNGVICLATTSLTSYQQLQGAKTKGAEVEVEWRPIAPLTFNGTFGYTDWSSPEIDNCDFNQDGQPDPGVNCNGRAAYVPGINWSVGAAYEFALGSGSKFTPRADVYGQSEICSGVTSGLSCAGGYELVNVRLQWTSPEGKWMAALGGTNVADKEYFLNIFDLTPFGQNTVEGQPGRPAEWYLTLNRKF